MDLGLGATLEFEGIWTEEKGLLWTLYLDPF